MSDRTFDNMIDEFIQCYLRQDYTGATELLNREAANFPDQAAIITYHHVCMLSLQNLVSEALALLNQAANKGYWYDATSLHQNPDFACLQGNSEFEALVERFQAMYEVKQAATSTSRIVVEPANGTSKLNPLLLVMHGNRSNAAITTKYWEMAAQTGWLVGLPQSSQIGFTATTFNWNDETRGLHDIEQHRSDLMQMYHVPPQRVVVGGFSMGGWLATLIAVTQPFAVQGVIALSPYLAYKFTEWPTILPTVAERRTRFYLVVGDNDHPTYQFVLQFADMLKAASVPHRLKVYPGMGHQYPPDFTMILPEALEFVSTGE